MLAMFPPRFLDAAIRGELLQRNLENLGPLSRDVMLSDLSGLNFNFPSSYEMT